MTALALVGDWNATPGDRGRGSPHWISVRGGLRIHSAGPGRHGDIDYVLSDCHTSSADRVPPPTGPSRSDHDVFTCTLYDPHGAGDRWLTLMSHNLRFGRQPSVVRGQLRQLLERYKPDVVALQEAADYHRELRQLADELGYRMVAWSGVGRMHNVLLVRSGHTVSRPQLLKLSPRGWRIITGGTHQELYGASCTVDWLRVVDVHMPPSVNWRARVPYGPPMRVAAMLAAAGRLARMARRHHKRQ